MDRSPDEKRTSSAGLLENLSAPERLARSVREAREALGLTSQELAHRSGAPHEVVIALESAGHTNFSLDCLERVASALGLRLDVQLVPAEEGSTHRREAELEAACRGLLQDIGEVLERQGEDWWDDTVTSGLHHRELAERCLGEKGD